MSDIYDAAAEPKEVYYLADDSGDDNESDIREFWDPPVSSNRGVAIHPFDRPSNIQSGICPHFKRQPNLDYRNTLYDRYGQTICPTCSYDSGYYGKPIGYMMINENSITRRRSPISKMIGVPRGSESLCPCCYGNKCFCPHHAGGSGGVTLDFMVSFNKRLKLFKK